MTFFFKRKYTGYKDIRISLFSDSSVSLFKTAVFTEDHEIVGLKCENVEKFATDMGQFSQTPIKQYTCRHKHNHRTNMY